MVIIILTYSRTLWKKTRCLNFSLSSLSCRYQVWMSFVCPDVFFAVVSCPWGPGARSPSKKMFKHKKIILYKNILNTFWSKAFNTPPSVHEPGSPPPWLHPVYCFASVIAVCSSMDVPAGTGGTKVW